MTALEKMASFHTESDEYHGTKLEKCCRVCMWILTVRCATSYWPKVREGDRKRQRNEGISTARAARALPTLSSKMHQKVGEGRNHCMWHGFYCLPQLSLFLICCAWCVTASLTVPWRHRAGRWLHQRTCARMSIGMIHLSTCFNER